MKEITIEFTEDMIEKEDVPHYEGYFGTYVLRQLEWKQKNDAIDKATTFERVTLTPNVSSSRLNYEMLSTMLISAPFKHSPKKPNREAINAMPSPLGDYLYNKCNELNAPLTLTRKKS